MPTTPAQLSRNGRRQDRPEQPAAPTGENFAPPPKLRRRPALVAASIAAVCLGALASVWAYTATSTAHDVLAVRRTVERGDVITRQDLMTVQIGVDPALHPLPGSAIGSVVGKHAAMDMPAGGVVTQQQVTSATVPEAGSSVVGLSLAAAMLPAGQLNVGDPVRVVTTPGQQGEITTRQPAAIDAVVVGTAKDAATGNAIVNVQVPYADAPDVAARAATGKVAVVLDSREQ